MLRNVPEHPATGVAPKVFLALALHSDDRQPGAATHAWHPATLRCNR